MHLESRLSSKIETASQLLEEAASQHAPAVFSSSYGLEDMVIGDLIAKGALPIEIATLDTGRLFEETYAVMQAAKKRYPQLHFTIVFPDATDVEPFVNAHGPNAFYQSKALRQQCCDIRKVKPLQRLLAGKKSWITGIRRQQSVTRKDTPFKAFDADHNVWKFNPLADWSYEEIWHYIRQNEVPYNALHDKGYPSVGCASCTRPIAVGEDDRAGRWWWEEPEARECGLHVQQRGG